MERKADKFRGIPFKYLPYEDQRSLANYLDQFDGSGKNYISFAQKMEKKCDFRFGAEELSAYKVLRDRARDSATIDLFDQYYMPNPNITLDYVYMVLEEMGLEDCTDVLQNSYPEIMKRFEIGQMNPMGGAHRPYDVHQCLCDECRVNHSNSATVPISHQCHHQSITSHPSHNTPRMAPSPNSPTSNQSSEHQRLQQMFTAPPLPVDPRSPQNNLGVTQSEHISDRPTWTPRGAVGPGQENSPYPNGRPHMDNVGTHYMDTSRPRMDNVRPHMGNDRPCVGNTGTHNVRPHMGNDRPRVDNIGTHNVRQCMGNVGQQASTSTVQLPYFEGSSLKTPQTQVSTTAGSVVGPGTKAPTPPGPNTGAIPKQPREHYSISDESPLSPLEQQSQADNRRNSSSDEYSSVGYRYNPPSVHDYHPMYPVNDLGRDNRYGPVSNKQCTCPMGRLGPSVTGSQYQNNGHAQLNSQNNGHCQLNSQNNGHSSLNSQNNGHSPLNSQLNRRTPLNSPNDFIPPSDSEDDESEQTKVLEVVTSSSTQCTCPSRNSNNTTRRSSSKFDDERRHSNPPDSLSSSNNCSEVVRRSSSDEELKRNNLSPQVSIVVSKRGQVRLFLTFADDSERHLDEVLSLGTKLKTMGFNVKCDMFNRTIQKLINQPPTQDSQNSMQQLFSNTNDWLDYQVQHAEYLVFCISPRYFEYVKPREQNDGSNNVHTNSVHGACGGREEVQPNDCQLHTKYIYNQACSEHINSLTQNRRFYPVLFSNSGASQRHIPSIFKSTLIFNYPDRQNSLLTFLSNQLTDRCSR